MLLKWHKPLSHTIVAQTHDITHFICVLKHLIFDMINQQFCDTNLWNFQMYGTQWAKHFPLNDPVELKKTTSLHIVIHDLKDQHQKQIKWSQRTYDWKNEFRIMIQLQYVRKLMINNMGCCITQVDWILMDSWILIKHRLSFTTLHFMDLVFILCAALSNFCHRLRLEACKFIFSVTLGWRFEMDHVSYPVETKTWIEIVFTDDVEDLRFCDEKSLCPVIMADSLCRSTIWMKDPSNSNWSIRMINMTSFLIWMICHHL